MKLIKKFYRNYSTNGLSKYWLKDRFDEKYWLDYLNTWNHPHRLYLVSILKNLPFIALFEVGCGSGPNIKTIINYLPGKTLGGVDINPKAIEIANKTFKGGHFRVASGDNIIMTDKSTDVILSDMCLIYVGPRKIKDYLKEMKRIARNHIVLHEYHEKNWWRRQWLRIFSGRHSYNYKKLLNKLGYYDIMTIKMPKFDKEDNEHRFRYTIIAKVPRR